MPHGISAMACPSLRGSDAPSFTPVGALGQRNDGAGILEAIDIGLEETLRRLANDHGENQTGLQRRRSIVSS